MTLEYCTVADVQRAAGNSEAATGDVEENIEDAQAYVDAFYKTTFKSKQITRLLDGNGYRYLYLNLYPIVSIDNLEIDGVSVTVPTNLYVYNEEGKIVLKDNAEVNFFKYYPPQAVNITWTYGLNLNFTKTTGDRMAMLIRNLTASIAAIATLTNQIGGTFDDVTSYSLPEFSASKGEPYTNIRATIKELRDKVDNIMAKKELKALFNYGVFH